MARLRSFTRFLLLGSALGISAPLEAAQVNGRITTGGYLSNENLELSADGTTRNDFATISNRFYLDVSEWGSPGFRAVLDLRDKHDFFDLLDKERLSLYGVNRLQLRQVALLYPNEHNGFFAGLGRFPVVEAGAVYADGALAGWRWNPALSSGLFGGFDPRRRDLSYLEFRSNAKVMGAYLLYQPKYRGFDTSLYVSNALVRQQFESETDRFFWYQQVVLQPDRRNRLTALSYLDFVPSLKVQNLHLDYHREFTEQFMADLGVSAIDVIEYLRRQDVRERLAPSPYREGRFRLTRQMAPTWSLLGETIQGKRMADGYWLNEFSAGVQASRFGGMDNLGAYGWIGYRHNFVSQDKFVRFGASSSSRSWEFGLDEKIALQNYDSGEVLTVFMTELSASRFLSRELFGTFSIEHALDQRVSILSGYLSVTYRFGNRAIPPLRDGAAPQGRL